MESAAFLLYASTILHCKSSRANLIKVAANEIPSISSECFLSVD